MSRDSHPLARYRARMKPPLTQDGLGALIGVDGMTISRWERRESLPQKRHWPRIEAVTGLSRGEIIAAYSEEPVT